MDTFIYIGIALAVVVALFFAFGKKRSEPEQLAPKKDAEALPAAEEKPAAKKLADEAAKKEPVPSAADQAPTSDAAEPAKVAKEDEQQVVAGPPAGAKPAPSPPTPKPAPVEEAKRDISGLRKGLSRSRDSEGFFGRLKSLFSGKAEISPEIVDNLEEVLLGSDVGVATTSAMLERVRSDLSSGELKDEAAVWEALREQARQLLSFDGGAPGLKLQTQPTVVLLVGVNGAGKTTTIGKLATNLKSQGISCVLAAGDTFRAAAVQQLIHWGKRVGCEVVRGKDGADPGSVVFDAIKKAQDLGAQVVLADTAGRLHTKSNLMAEMQKIARTAGKAMDGAPHEVLLVIDSTNGQNALAQAKEFKESLPLSGIVLTKLDGTAKGGVVLGIADSLKLPVRFIGLGERPDDLHEFVVDDFVEALLGKDA